MQKFLIVIENHSDDPRDRTREAEDAYKRLAKSARDYLERWLSDPAPKTSTVAIALPSGLRLRVYNMGADAEVGSPPEIVVRYEQPVEPVKP